MFKSKVVIVTGSSSGIGACAAIRLASDGAKAVVIHGRQEEKLKKVKEECEKASKGNVKVHICVGDITDENVRKNLINSTIDQFGQLDILVNNAGLGAPSSLTASKMESYDEMFNVNVRSVMALTQLAIPHLIKAKGNVINISSSAGIKPFPMFFFYSCSKAALDHFTKCLALELGPQGVRVNSVNPSLIPETEFNRRRGVTEDEIKTIIGYVEKAYPLRRAGTTEEVVNAIVYLASDNSKFVTGVIFPVDGGETIS